MVGKFVKFFESTGHKLVPSSSLLPPDPSVLLTAAGMQQFKPYYTFELDPLRDFGAARVISVQKCFRTSDIEEVGDATHCTFFEMLGNFSFGDYFREEAIAWAYKFITEELGVSLDRMYVTVFGGEGAVPKDEASYEIWKKLGVPEEKIKWSGMADNFWGPTGKEGPCGPTTEIYVDGVEVWNVVFNEYYSSGSREELLALKVKLEKLAKPGIDTGMGLERLLMTLNGYKNVYETDVLFGLFDLGLKAGLSERRARLFADHLRSSSFLISDSIRPSNREAGYILRRLLRRMLADNLSEEILQKGVNWVVEKYRETYPSLKSDEILAVILEEKKKFEKVINNGLKELGKLDRVNIETAFKLYESHGLPFDLIMDFVPEGRREGLSYAAFEERFKKHQEASRAGAEKKFGGHGLVLDTGELKAGSEADLVKVTRLHTATHLLQAALRKVLGDTVSQKGSDITVDRARFDFGFERKLTEEEIKKVEVLVNEKIALALPVKFVKMPLEEAKKTGALFFFKEKYPSEVNVYFVGESLSEAVSAEFCGGPHVKNTSEIGTFKILKDEGVGAGMRRIRVNVL